MSHDHFNLHSFKRIPPWTWIAALFAGQVLGCVAVATVLGLPPGEIAMPVVTLFCGFAMALLLGKTATSAEEKEWRRWIPVAIYYLFIFFLSDRGYSRTPSHASFFHPIEFATLGLLVAWALMPLLSNRRRFMYFMLFTAMGALAGLLDEVHQLFVPGRTFSLGDLALDVLGLAVGMTLLQGAIHIFSNGRNGRK